MRSILRWALFLDPRFVNSRLVERRAISAMCGRNPSARSMSCLARCRLSITLAGLTRFKMCTLTLLRSLWSVDRPLLIFLPTTLHTGPIGPCGTVGNSISILLDCVVTKTVHGTRSLSIGDGSHCGLTHKYSALGLLLHLHLTSDKCLYLSTILMTAGRVSHCIC